jgi:hypothetical protein
VIRRLGEKIKEDYAIKTTTLLNCYFLTVQNRIAISIASVRDFLSILEVAFPLARAQEKDNLNPYA